MKTGFTPWFDTMLEHVLRNQRAVCFALGCLEREHRLNLAALAAYWVQASSTCWTPQLPRVDQPGARMAAATSRPPSPRQGGIAS